MQTGLLLLNVEYDGHNHALELVIWIVANNACQLYLFSRKRADFVVCLDGLESLAVLGFDTKRNRVLIPLIKGNELVIQPLK